MSVINIILSLFNRYKTPVVAGVVIAVLTGSYFKGRSDEGAKWKMKQAKVEHALHLLEARGDSLALAINTATSARIEAERKASSAVSARIANKRPVIDAQGKLPDDAVNIFNQSAQGSK